jgi:hypothetical protein
VLHMCVCVCVCEREREREKLILLPSKGAPREMAGLNGDEVTAG